MVAHNKIIFFRHIDITLWPTVSKKYRHRMKRRGKIELICIYIGNDKETK